MRRDTVLDWRAPGKVGDNKVFSKMHKTGSDKWQA
jgi:hypothetical protein